jgi:hypothetical protein
VPPPNTDGTDAPDYADADSDNAGGNDMAAAGNASLDADGDGRLDAPLADSDSDGLDDRVDTSVEPTRRSFEDQSGARSTSMPRNLTIR